MREDDGKPCSSRIGGASLGPASREKIERPSTCTVRYAVFCCSMSGSLPCANSCGEAIKAKIRTRIFTKNDSNVPKQPSDIVSRCDSIRLPPLDCLRYMKLDCGRGKTSHTFFARHADVRRCTEDETPGLIRTRVSRRGRGF